MLMSYVSKQASLPADKFALSWSPAALGQAHLFHSSSHICNKQIIVLFCVSLPSLPPQSGSKEIKTQKTSQQEITG